MDEVSWIEVTSRSRDGMTRQRIGADALTIGRAYDNDVVLDDPHVAAHHLRLVRGADGAWIAEDLGSLNGLYVEGESVRRERVVLDALIALRVGTTRLRVRTSRQPVAPERLVQRKKARWPAALGCFVLVFALALLDLWLEETTAPKLIRYLTPLLALALMVAIWASAWSVLSRIFSGYARYGLHLLIVGIGLLLYTLYAELCGLGAFALSWTALARFTYVGAWLTLAGVCFAHLRAVGNTHLAIKAAAVFALAALGITMQSLKLSEWRSNTGQPIILQRLQPPSLRVVRAQGETAFLAHAKDLKILLDKARSDTTGESGAESADDE